ncbi:MAG: hypothetical protein JNJ88_00395 [Planctomycetes bacterium]|nr:hypothetical protein [Planctomycetota bacterium]
MHPIFKKLAIAVASPVIFLGAAEFAAETLDYVPRRQSPISFWGEAHDSQFDEQDAPFRPHTGWFWEPRPGGLFVGERINADGYRGRIFARTKSAAFRIAALGDSSTMGYGVREAESWPRKLEDELRSHGYDAEVLNFGVVGFSSFQGRQYYSGKALQYAPDLVITAFGAINEQFTAERGLTDILKSQYLSRPKYQIRNALGRFTVFRWLEQHFGQTEKIDLAALASRPDSAPAKLPRVSPTEFIAFHREIAGTQRARGAKFAMVDVPRMRIVERDFPTTPSYTEAIHTVAKELGVPLAPVYQRFRELEVQRNRHPQWTEDRNAEFLDMVHPSVAGHQLYAQIVAKSLLEGGILPDSAKTLTVSAPK